MRGPGRCGGTARGEIALGVLLLSLSDGRLGEDKVGLIEEGGVRELDEAVSSVDDDCPEVTSPLDWDSVDLVSGDLVVVKLALERRRSVLNNGMVDDLS